MIKQILSDKIKDPIEYLKRLEFHKNAKSLDDYIV